MDRVVIIGAGQAGGWVARTLRSQGFEGRITLIGAEPHAPYERPPLSKSVLLGTEPPDVTNLFDDFPFLDLNFRAGVRAESIDRAGKQVVLKDSTTVPYDRLVLATGGQARALPGAGDRVMYLRTIADSLALHERLAAVKKVAVIGGGWIGLEVAAAARKLSADVTVYEAADRLSGRTVPPEISVYLHELHSRHGVHVELNAMVTDLDALDADVIVAGIGLVPDTALAEAAGLAVDNGIVVDAAGRTSDPDIYAVGDAANRHNPVLGRRVRLESWGNAQDQGIAVAKTLLGIDPGDEAPPWFWSDQFDVNIQILGLPETWGEPVRRPGDRPDKFTLFYLDGDRLAAVIAVNDAMAVKVGRRLMAAGKAVDPAVLADPSTNLRSLLR